MKKSQLRKIIRESIKQLMTEHHPGSDSTEYHYFDPSRNGMLVGLFWVNGVIQTTGQTQLAGCTDSDASNNVGYHPSNNPQGARYDCSGNMMPFGTSGNWPFQGGSHTQPPANVDWSCCIYAYCPDPNAVSCDDPYCQDPSDPCNINQNWSAVVGSFCFVDPNWGPPINQIGCGGTIGDTSCCIMGTTSSGCDPSAPFPPNFNLSSWTSYWTGLPNFSNTTNPNQPCNFVCQRRNQWTAQLAAGGMGPKQTNTVSCKLEEAEAQYLTHNCATSNANNCP